MSAEGVPIHQTGRTAYGAGRMGGVPRHASLLERPILFAHRGAKAQLPENTLPAFELAVRLGATGLESDVWVTSDGVAVLDHDGELGRRPFRKPISSFLRAELPEHIPSLAEFYEAMGTDWPLSLDVKTAEAFDATVEAARAAGAEEQLWLCHPELEVLMGWREHTTAKLVDSTRLKKLDGGPERRAAQLRDLGIDGINLRLPDWNAGLVTLFHRFGRTAFGWDAQHVREIVALIDMGIDAVYSDHSERMAESYAAMFPDDDPLGPSDLDAPEEDA